MKIAFANDHAATAERDALIEKIRSLGHEVIDLGTAENVSVDYPDYAASAAKELVHGRVDRAVLVCGSGIGMCMTANKFPHVRCALATDLYGAEMSRRHNNANCLALRSREQSEALNEQILETWLTTPFDGNRHERRVEKIDSEAKAEWREEIK